MALFATTILLSASMLFVVQPMVARMILPRLGGTPSTWTTCLLFFQVALLAGYLYVHLSSSKLGRRAQVIVHVFLLGAAMLVPLGLSSESHPDRGAPVVWLLATLAGSVGLPFFAVSATAPLLQRWFAQASGRDPYFLYAASNFGSLVGLLGYPLWVERMFTLADQRAMWSVGFTVLTVLICLCAATVFRNDRSESGSRGAVHPTLAPDIVRVTWAQRAWWLVLSFVPSSLLLGVTTHISTDVAAVPLLWVLPLSLYLLSFTAAFASRPPISHRWATRVAGVLIVAAITANVVGANWWWGLTIHLAAFAAVALTCHRELAERRPTPSALTHYYLLISVGGALGGIFNAVVAPQVFTQVLEYPLVLVLAAWLLPSPDWRAGRKEPLAAVLGLPIFVFCVVAASWAFGLASRADIGPNTTAFWVCAALALAFVNRREALGVALAVAVLAHAWFPRETDGRVIFAARSFFGVHRVTEDAQRDYHRLSHGTTVHGVQKLHVDGCEPTGYYPLDGPIGQLLSGRKNRVMDVGVIGLGAGALVCHAVPGSRWTFFEIDPAVESIARNPSLFTFLSRAPGSVNVVIGDGRINLAEFAPGAFDVLIADAFSSDAVPVHLLTIEFIRLALDRLRPEGVLAFHISNRYLDLGPILGAAAKSLGAVALEQSHAPNSRDALASRWLLVGRDREALVDLASDRRWREPAPSDRAWSDDFSNIFDAVSWRASR